MEMFRCFRISSIVWMAFSFTIGGNAFCTAQVESASVTLLPTRHVSLKSCGWEPEHLVVHHTGYISLNLEFDRQGNLWSGFDVKSEQLVTRSLACRTSR